MPLAMNPGGMQYRSPTRDGLLTFMFAATTAVTLVVATGCPEKSSTRSESKSYDDVGIAGRDAWTPDVTVAPAPRLTLEEKPPPPPEDRRQSKR